VTVPSPAVADDTETRLLTIATADGVSLEAEARLPGPGAGGDEAVAGAVVLAHPHPLQGGSMASLVTSELFRLLPRRGLAALRFNFRGVGNSGGEHGHGRTEAADITAALETMEGLWPHRPLVLCGWSFGADVSLSLTDPRIDGWVAIAPPLRVLPVEELAAAAGADPRPTLLLVPEHDEFRPPDAARAATEGWTNTTIEVVSGADHFLVGRTEKVARLVADFAAACLPA
jgi:alpha/beta superfamily hydrolase